MTEKLELPSEGKLTSRDSRGKPPRNSSCELVRVNFLMFNWMEFSSLLEALAPRTNKRCFLNGVFQSGPFGG